MGALADIIGASPGIQRLREQLEQILKRAVTARRPPPILLRGETGTGKGLVARTLHRSGPRATAPFVDVNCAAIPENLLEAELFGYERGAFTGAHQAKAGLFQLAHRGTLFLDEVGMLSPPLQAKLLKVLEDGVVRRLGGTRPEPVDVWIVSATNEDLAESLRERRFRDDLYHRLAVLSLELPPLRERGADILLLAERFLERACADYGLSPKTFARDARVALGAYGWPGNVRELGNAIERVALFTDEPMITASMLALPVSTTVAAPPAVEPVPAHTSRDRMRAHLLEGLTETGWNISQTAVRLGVARNTVLARMARFGLSRSTATSPARSRPVSGPPRDAAATGSGDRSAARVVSRTAWEPRRVALLRVDVVDASRALDEMAGKAETFGGDIVEQGPGAFVAAFGLEAIEDAPVRAALAALAISKATERARGSGAASHVKITVHVTQVLVSQLQGIWTIDMKSKRAAWRTIEALAGLDRLDTIVVSQACASFLERRFEFAPVAPSEPSDVPFRCLMRRERTGFGLGGRPLSRFVGRDGELRLVTDRVATAARGHGQVIGIVGEPGLGKSRFTYELTRLDVMRGWRLLGCGGVSHGSTTPFLPVGDLLRRYFAIEDADEPDVIREKVTDVVLGRHPELTSHLSPLLSLLDIAIGDEAWDRLDPRRRRQQIRDVMKRLLLDESQIQPLVVVVEDLHWVDAETHALLDSLVDSVPRARVVLLVTYRPEHPQAWSRKSYYTQIRIDPLPFDKAHAFLGGLLGEDETLEPLKRLLIDRTEGNPLFLEEGVRTLVESRALEGDPGAYRTARAVDAMQVPATVEAILAARIDRLAPDEQRLLQAAAVIGRNVPIALLQAIADQDQDSLRACLRRLQATEFLYETQIVPDVEYTFKHALTHEVAYDSLSEDRRRALHAGIVDAIEALYADRVVEHIERLADHAWRGGLTEKAVAYLRRAGLKAAARSALPEARTWFERALAVLETMPKTPSTLEQAFESRLEMRQVLYHLGDGRQMLERLREAETLAERLNDDRRRGHVCAVMTTAHSLFGELDEALVTGTRAMEIAGRLADLDLRITASTYLGQTQYFRGEYERVVALATDNIAALPRDRVCEHFGVATPPSVHDRCFLIMSLAELGRFAEASEHEAQAVRIATLTQHAFTVGVTYCFAGMFRACRGDWANAGDLVEQAIGVFRTGDVVAVLPYAVAVSAWVLAELGETGEAVSRLREGEQLLDTYAAMGFVGHLGWFYDALARASLKLGRLDDARRLGDRAIEFSPSQPGFTARAHQLLGDVATHSERLGAQHGEIHYHHALALAEPRGMCPLVAHCHLGLGTMYARIGKRHEAQQHLRAAAAMYREMEMPFWIERAETDQIRR